MPYSNYDRKLQHGVEWRKKNSSAAYMKWLYQKRMVPKRQAEIMQEALKRIAVEKPSPEDAQQMAFGALEWCRQHEREIGNRYNHATETPYYKT